MTCLLLNIFEIVHSLWCFVQQHDLCEHPFTPETCMLSLDISLDFFLSLAALGAISINTLVKYDCHLSKAI